jgi:anti-sigma factor RsiW
MLSNDSSSSCGRAEALRDYAFDELAGNERRAMDEHIATCGDCAVELDRLRLTTAALRTLPDREIPQRIAFVSDRVFEPSAFARFWNAVLPSNRLGFASACVLALAMVVSAWHFSATSRPVEIRTVVQTASTPADPQQQISAAVAKAVAQVRVEDARMIQAALQESERKHDQEYRNQMVAIQERLMVLQKRLGASYASMASNEIPGSGVGQ